MSVYERIMEKRRKFLIIFIIYCIRFFILVRIFSHIQPFRKKECNHPSNKPITDLNTRPQTMTVNKWTIWAMQRAFNKAIETSGMLTSWKYNIKHMHAGMSDFVIKFPDIPLKQMVKNKKWLMTGILAR